MKLIKTRLELSHVSDLHRLKPPRIHLSLFPVNNWAPVGFPGRAGRLTSSLHSELDQEGPAGRRPTAKPPVVLLSYQPVVAGVDLGPPAGDWVIRAASWGSQGPHAGSQAPSLPPFTWSTKLQSSAELASPGWWEAVAWPLRGLKGHCLFRCVPLPPVYKRNEEMPKLGFKQWCCVSRVSYGSSLRPWERWPCVRCSHRSAEMTPELKGPCVCTRAITRMHAHTHAHAQPCQDLVKIQGCSFRGVEAALDSVL